MAERITCFIEERRLRINSVADVGCGPAIMLFELARSMPGCEFHGLDSSRLILARDRSRARREKRDNLHFEYAKLPGLPRRTYDFVTCIATLHYVPRPDLAIRALYRIVEEGGHMLFNYPNRLQRAAYRQAAVKDPTVATRFALVLSGRSLMTRAKVEKLLGCRPIDFWASVHEPTMEDNPCVVVAKGKRH